jgi:hypothetical protein
MWPTPAPALLTRGTARRNLNSCGLPFRIQGKQVEPTRDFQALPYGPL